MAFNGYARECPAVSKPELPLIGSDVWSNLPQFTYDLVDAPEGLRVAADPRPSGPPYTLCPSAFDYIAATLPEH